MGRHVEDEVHFAFENLAADSAHIRLLAWLRRSSCTAFLNLGGSNSKPITVRPGAIEGIAVHYRLDGRRRYLMGKIARKQGGPQSLDFAKAPRRVQASAPARADATRGDGGAPWAPNS
jgi:hypothetical protein